MKHNHVSQTITAFVLALMMLLSAPAALAEETAAELPDGVTWDMTVEDMLALEGVTEDDDLYIQEGNGYTQYGFVRIGAYIQVAVYIYNAGGLVMYGYTASTSMQAGAVSFADAYTDLLALMTQRYGGPAEEDVQRAVDAANTVQADVLSADAAEVYAGWDLGGGTMLYHLLLDSDGEETLYTMFVNESLLYAQ